MIVSVMRNLRLMIVAAPLFVFGGIAAWQIVQYLKRRSFKSCRKPNQIRIVSTVAQWTKIYPTILEDTADIKVLGLDCEWVHDRQNGITYPVALLQLATFQGLCVLVRLNKLSSNLPKSLLKLLSDRSILKVGVAVKNDGIKLFKDYRITLSGCVDLRHVIKRTRGHYHCKTRGLAGLTEAVLGVTINKDQSVRCGNWEAEPLSEVQVEYAALDALVGIDIYIKLILTKILGSVPTTQQLEVNTFCISDFNRTSRSVCQGIIDISYKRQFETDQEQDSSSKTKKPKQEGSLRAYTVRKKPLYHNCQLEAPDGQVLCTCGVSKAEWYISNGLGVKVCDDPFRVRLNFEPSGRPESENNYYLQFKDNVCVVCGQSDSYLRKFVVPQEYRKFFPYVVKAHTSHDVLLLCPPCHHSSSQYDSDLRQELAFGCSAPLSTGTTAKCYEDPDLHKIKSAAKALLLNKGKIPAARVTVLKNIVKQHFNVEEISDELLTEAMEMDIKIYNGDFVPHAEKVVQYMKQNGGLLEFEKRWRKHFVDTMNPQYLPPFWSVNHVHQQAAELYGDKGL